MKFVKFIPWDSDIGTNHSSKTPLNHLDEKRTFYWPPFIDWVISSFGTALGRLWVKTHRISRKDGEELAYLGPKVPKVSWVNSIYLCFSSVFARGHPHQDYRYDYFTALGCPWIKQSLTSSFQVCPRTDQTRNMAENGIFKQRERFPTSMVDNVVLYVSCFTQSEEMIQMSRMQYTIIPSELSRTFFGCYNTRQGSFRRSNESASSRIRPFFLLRRPIRRLHIVCVLNRNSQYKHKQLQFWHRPQADTFQAISVVYLKMGIAFSLTVWNRYRW